MEVSVKLHAPASLPQAKNTLWIGVWVGPRAGLEAVEKRTNSHTIPALSVRTELSWLMDISNKLVHLIGIRILLCCQFLYDEPSLRQSI